MRKLQKKKGKQPETACRRKRAKQWMLVMAWVLIFILGISENVRAAGYENPDTGYRVVIEDDADLLTEQEESELALQMQELTLYGNAALKTIADNFGTTESYIASYYRSTFGNDSGTVFLIDLDNRNIWLYSDGAVYQTITRSRADTITDNVYTYASDGQYFLCASKAFEQEETLLRGGRIAQPMKHVSNALFAMVIALFINYFVVQIFSRTRELSDSELLAGMSAVQDLEHVKGEYKTTTSVYSPTSSGGRGGRSGGGGGGGGRSGGGGGHSF
ncbi:MAG: TPM domain-containing protein [Bacteroidales bacterium]|nr:TPM domain-containing protein [Clostridium sp.]MCM1204869.1 TPM domain-containing protein [Bacteroidales bacterium]